MIRISLTIFFVSCALLMSARNLFNVKQQDQTRLCEGFVEEMDYATDIEKGMGRVVLKKNMVDGVNTLTQAMLGAANVVYVIKYNFTLGEDVIIPAGCVLKFEGGSIRGGRMIMNNTSIVSKKTAFYDVVIPKSSIKTENPVYLKWFSSSNDLQTLYNAVNTSNIVICEEGKIYYFTEDILDSDYNGFLYENLEIVGNHCNWVFGNHFVKYGYHTLFRICNGATVNAHNINIEWKNSYFYSNCYHLFTFDGEEFTKGECGYFKNIHIICTEDNCGFGTLVNAYYGKEFLFEDCSIEYVGNNSKQIGGSFVYIMPAYDNMSTSVEMRNCYCKCTGTDEPFTISIMWKSGQAYSSAVSRKVKATIDNCVFIKEDDANNASAFNFVEQGVGNKVDNNYVIDAIFTNCRFVAKSTNRLLTCLTQTLFRGVGNVLYSGCEFISKCSDDSLLSGNAVNDGAVLYFSPCNRNDFLTVFQNCIFEGTNNCGLINHDSYLEANVIFDKCIMNLDNIQNGLGDVATGYVQVVPTLSNCTINLKQNKLFIPKRINIYKCNFNIPETNEFAFNFPITSTGFFGSGGLLVRILDCKINDCIYPDFDSDKNVLLLCGHTCWNSGLYYNMSLVSQDAERLCLLNTSGQEKKFVLYGNTISVAANSIYPVTQSADNGIPKGKDSYELVDNNNRNVAYHMSLTLYNKQTKQNR